MINPIKIPEFSIIEYCIELSKLVENGKIVEFGNSLSTFNTSEFYSRCFLGAAQDNSRFLTLNDVQADTKTALGYGIHVISYTEELLPSGTDKLLEEAGFFRFITQTGMIFDKDTTFEETHDPHITTIETSHMDEWQTALIKGFGPDKAWEYNVFEPLSTNSAIKFYAYKENSEILGTSVLHINGENSGIHEVSVIPEARRKGIALKLVGRMLTDMKKEGHFGASLQASDAGFYVYEKVGFKPISKIHTYILK